MRRQDSFADSIRKLATQATGRNTAATSSFEKLEPRQLMAVDVILEWNDVMLQANANDYALLAPEQAGPIKTSHSFAIVSGAMYDALNSVENVGDPFLFTAKRGRGSDANAAVAQAAHDTLLSLYPSQKQFLDSALQKTLDRIVDGPAESSGVRIGAEVAFAILTARANDGINSISDPSYSPKNLVGFHNVDPLHPNQGVHGSGASNVDGFAIDDFTSFAVPSLDDGTPAGREAFLQSDAYEQAYNEVQTLGGDGLNTPTSRTEEQTLIGQFWGYDGRPGLGTIPRLYNQIATVIAKQLGTSEAENARLFALINIAMADAGIAAWASKYDADFWHPILAIRNGELDGNPSTAGDATWTPFGAQASNPRDGETNSTPNFPAYVSGHAAFGAATFKTLKNFFSTDNIAFSFVSDEFNGTTVGASGAIRPRLERTFDSLTAAKLENAKSRVYLGIHWDFDTEAGLDLGDSIADFVYNNTLQPNVSQNSDPWNSPDRRFWHNGFDPEDVNNDGDVNPLDALILINALNNKDDSSNRHDFMDVNDDRDQSPLDVLQVINRINASQRNSNGGSTTEPNTLPSGSRSYDGTGNNFLHPQWGSTDEQLIRVSAADYDDGISSPAGADRPSARTISNALATHVAEATPSDRQMSAYIYVWGQFIDHDLGLTKSATPRESFSIAVPANDAEFDPTGSGAQTIPMTRSIYDTSTGTSTANPRQQISQVTAWIDGSMVYGSDAARAATLRTFVGGKMKSQSTSVGELLPLNTEGLTMANDAHRVPDSQLFAAGDVRANENIELTAMQVLFVREHNRLAKKLAAEQPQLTDEQLYQKAREIVIAELQAITYNQWLPALIGTNALTAYRGYNPAVNPGIANEFSTAAYRLHSSINDDVEFFDDAGLPISFEYTNDAGQTVAVDGGVSLSEAFFNPTLFKQTGVDGILKYAASTRAEEIDTQVVGSLRNFLFGAPGQGGLDLASLNIQRGRDHGLADYNSIRAAYGLPRVSSFAQITSDALLQQKLATLYGTVDNIDAWVGFLAEDHARGASVSTTSQRIIADQFQRVRDGDRFWYERVFSGRQLAELQRTTLEDVIERNTGVTSLQENVFFFRAELSGQVYYDLNGNSQMDRREKYASHITVELRNDAGEVIGQAVTDRFGRYFLNDIPETGDFRVRVVAPAGMEVTTASELNAHILSGDVRLRNLNFGLRSVT